MATPQASSRLELLQARFQQKQLLEKEQKLLQLYDQQQQRAYQVVQRGSAGSNSSGHGSTISQQTITKTTSTAHTTSNSQGGKVRQMFDERRQTNVKGIDRSYPLEPLENKPRKQVNKSIVQKNGNLTVNRQSVTMKRMARADVNSNLNGGKPIVSYHEEITQESFGPAGHQELDDNEFGNENHITRYANENQAHIEEVLDEDTIGRNRMMAKLHLMDYDETLKHRVRNDLESEEFPEDFMVDVPDKLPKQSVKKTLSQAEARLERFKNVNAKRSSNVTKKSNTMSKKRPDHVLPEKSTSSKDNSKHGIQEVSDRGYEEGGSNIKVVSHKSVTEETSMSSNLEKNMKRKSQSLQSFCKRAEKLITAENGEELKDWRRGGESTKFFCQKSEKLATTSATRSKTASKLSPELSKDMRRGSEKSSTLDLKGPEKSASICAMDSENKEKRSSTFSKNTQRQSEVPKISDAKTTRLSGHLTKNRTIRSKFPKFLRKESEKSANSCAVNSCTVANVSPKSSKVIDKPTETSLNRKKPEYSGATVMFDSETAKQLLSTPLSTAIRRSESPKYYNEKAEKSSVNCLIDLKRRSSSPNFVLNTKCPSIKIESKQDGIIPVQSSSSIMDRSVSLDVTDRNEKPRTLNKIDKSFSPTSVKNRTTAYKETEAKMSSRSARNDSPVSSERRRRSRKPSEKFVGAPVTKNSKGARFTSKSPDFVEKIASKRRESVPTIQPAKSKSPNSMKRSSGKCNASRQFFPSDFERSATVTLMTPETSLRKESQSGKRDYEADTSVTDDTATTGRRTSEEIVDANSKRSIRNSVSLFFLQQCDAASRNLEHNEENNISSVALGEDQHWSHDSSPLSLKDMSTSNSATSNLSRGQTGEPILVTGIANSRNFAPLLCSRSSNSPSPELRGDKFDLKSTKCTSIQRAGVHRQIGRENSYEKSKSPDNFACRKDTGKRIGRESPLVLRSTRLIRDTIKRQNNKNRAKNVAGNDAEDTMKALESVSSSARNTDGTSTVVDPSESKHRSILEEKKVETRSEIGERRCSTPFTPPRMELPAVGTSPTNFGFMEVDTEIQEIVMPDQYIECHPRGGSSKLCRETRDYGRERPNAEKFFTYSVSKPAKKRRPSLESNVFTLSRKDQRVVSGSDKLVCSKHTIRNATSSPSATSSSTFRGSNRSKEGSGELNREINAVPVKTRGEIDLDERGQTETERNWSNSPCPEKKNEKMYRKFDAVARQLQTEMDFNEREKEERDNLKFTKRNRSTNPSPTNNLSSCGSKCLEEENRQINQKINTGYLQSREKMVPDDGREEKRYSLKHTIRDLSNSPSPTNNSTFRSSKYPTEKNKNINRKMDTAAVRSQEKIKLNECKKEEYRCSKHTKRNCLSSSPSPTNNRDLRSSKRPKKTAEKLNQEIGINNNLRSEQETLNSIRLNAKKKLLDKSDQEEVDDLNDAIRGASNSPPIGEFTVRSSKRVKSVNVASNSDKAENLQPRQVKTIPNEPRKEDNSKLLQSAIADRPVTTNSKRRLIQAVESRRNETATSRKKTPSSIQQRPKQLCSKSPQISKRIQTSPSLEVARTAVKRQGTKQEAKPGPSHNETTITEITALTKQTEIQKTDSGGVMNVQMSKNYGRTDSVESALKRFDSIGAESVHSMAEKVRTLDESRNESTSVSLKTLDRIDVNHLRSPKNEQRRTPLSGNSMVSQKRDQDNESKTRATQGKREFAKTRNSTEVAWVTMASTSPACKRKLFQHADFEQKCHMDNSKTKQSSVSMKSPPPDPNIALIRHESSAETLLEKNKLETRKIDETFIGASFSAPVKQLRSIEDIRKSIDSNFEREKAEGRSTRSAIANSPPKRSNAIQSTRLNSHPANVDDHVDGSRKRTPLSRRSDNLTVKNDALGDAERVKYSMRFSRVAKNPSPDPTNGNARRNVSSSSSKASDTTVTCSSIELKTQEARSTKHSMPMKGTESIGNRKTMTSTSTKKSMDAVDGAILENDLHLRDQTPGTLHDNDTITATMKKDDALVIEFDEQLPKENHTALSRKPLLRKRSTDKQTLPTQSSRPPSSHSTVSGGSTMQGQVSSSKNKTVSKAKTSSSGASHKGPSGYKSGLTSTVDNLVPCKTCGRRFAQDRVALHEQICTKTAQKKRKQFDAMMYRVKGTDLEPFVKKGLSKKQPEKFKKCEPKSNWRRKHEDFINAIRSAKQVQAHLAAGGKLSDLPPPPPSDTSDYVQCPHCGRKFNQSAAERHIPKCEHMLHNKPVHSRGPKPKR